jgi:hypothetical protein
LSGVDTIFNRLFHDIALTPDQAMMVCVILIRLQRQQNLAEQAGLLANVTQRLRNVSLQVQRDSALRALLTNEADRATFDTNAASGARQGRGRSGGPPPDWTGGGGRGRAGSDTSAGGGGGARRGGARGNRWLADRAAGADTVIWRGQRGGNRGAASEAVVSYMSALTFDRLFDGIMLTTDQDASARALIARTQQELMAGMALLPTMILRLGPDNGQVSMRAGSAAALLEVLSNDADRAVLASRIVILPGR